jgi:hypothetical protein
MSSYHRAAILAAWIVAVSFLFSTATPAALADGAIAKVTKKSKAAKSPEKKDTDKKNTDKKDIEKKSEAEKLKNEKEFEEADDDSVSKSAAKATDKAAKADEKSAHSTTTKKAAKTLATVVRFSLNGEYPEGPSEAGMFGDLQPSLSKLIDRLDEAKADKEVAAVWLRIEDLELGRGKVNEVRAAIARVRKAGKPVYAELTSADTGAYLIA